MSITGVTNDQASAYGVRGAARSNDDTAPTHDGSGMVRRMQLGALAHRDAVHPGGGLPRELGVRRACPTR